MSNIQFTEPSGHLLITFHNYKHVKQLVKIMVEKQPQLAVCPVLAMNQYLALGGGGGGVFPGILVFNLDIHPVSPNY